MKVAKDFKNDENLIFDQNHENIDFPGFFRFRVHFSFGGNVENI